MCQLFSIGRASFDANCESWMAALRAGANINSHGSAALFIDETNGNHSIVRAMDWDDIEDVLETKRDWTRVLIHQRYGTRGARDVFNTHFWQVGDLFYCHNGVLRGEVSQDFEVDSHAIGHMLETGGIWAALQFLQEQDYANVFIVDLNEYCYYVSRSETNTLFTNSGGDYSTASVAGLVEQEVPRNSIVRHAFVKPVEAAPTYSGWFNSRADDDYESQVEASIHGDRKS